MSNARADADRADADRVNVARADVVRLFCAAPLDLSAPKKRKGGAAAAAGTTRDGASIVRAGAKTFKKAESERRRDLGPDPAEQLLIEGRRTGLRNLGATCYMNSLLQCLFMCRSFRQGVYRWSGHTANVHRRLGADCSYVADDLVRCSAAPAGGDGGDGIVSAADDGVGGVTGAGALEDVKGRRGHDSAEQSLVGSGGVSEEGGAGAVDHAGTVDTDADMDPATAAGPEAALEFTVGTETGTSAAGASSDAITLAAGHIDDGSECVAASSSALAASAYTVDDADICHQLQRLFCHLQYSNAAFYDPTQLSNALQLNTDVQQDAQEFNKLLLTFLREQLRESDDVGVANLIDDHFKGEFSYETVCRSCSTKSESSSSRIPFYEIELNLLGCTSVEEALANYVRSEALTGADQYSCATCAANRDATRRVVLRSLPPVICMQLCRFVYDVKTFSKKKLSTPVSFPEIIDMTRFTDGAQAPAANGRPPAANGSRPPLRYRLTATLMHVGNSAHSGHYQARIFDPAPGQSDVGQWWSFNDEVVTNETTTEGKLDENGVRVYTSRTAYMLHYTLDSFLEAAPAEVDASLDLRREVDEATKAIKAAAEHFQRQRKELEEEIEDAAALRAKTIELLEESAKLEPDGCVWLPSAWLQRLSSEWPAHVGPIDTGSLRCAHGGADPKQVQEMKLVSRQTWEFLHARFGGGPELSFESACQECCRELLEAERLEKVKGDDIALALTLLNDDADEESSLLMDVRSFVASHLKWIAAGEQNAHCTSICEHEMRKPRVSVRPISAQAFQQVCNLFPETRPLPAECAECGESQRRKRERERDERRERDTGPLKRLKKHLAVGDDDLPQTFFLLDAGWLDRWRSSDNGGSNDRSHSFVEPLPGSHLRCAHGKLRFHPWRALPCEWMDGAAPTSAFERACDQKIAEAVELATEIEARELASRFGILYANNEPQNASNKSVAGGGCGDGGGEHIGAPGGASVGDSVEAPAGRGNDAQDCAGSTGTHRSVHIDLTADRPDETPIDLDTEAEAGAEANGSTCSERQDFHVDVGPDDDLRSLLPYCIVRRDAQTAEMVVLADVCAECDAACYAKAEAENRSFTQATLHVIMVKERPAAATAAATAATAAATATATGTRRSGRAGGVAKGSVVCDAAHSVKHLKLLICQSNPREDFYPVQQVLFFDGRELLDDQTLGDAGIVPGGSIQMLLDTSIPGQFDPDMCEIIEMSSSSGKKREQQVENGFHGSALLGRRTV